MANPMDLDAETYSQLEKILNPVVLALIKQGLAAQATPVTVLDRVNPGDLITAEFMNRLISAVANLESRVLRLETAQTPSVKPVKIIRVTPSGPLHIDEQVEIEGENFEYFIGRTAVYFGDQSISRFKNGCTDTYLVFNVPHPGFAVSASGAQVRLKVSNSGSTDYRELTILPPKQVGGIDATIGSIEPEKPMAHEAVTFKFKMESTVSERAEFTVSLYLWELGNQQQLYDQFSLLSEDGTPLPNKKIWMDPSSTETAFVKVDALPFEQEKQFNVMLMFTAKNVTGYSDTPTYTVGKEDTDDKFLSLSSFTFDHPEWVIDNVPTIASGTSISCTALAELTTEALNAGVSAADCEVSATLKSGEGWKVRVVQPSPNPATNLNVGSVPLNIRFRVTSPSTASNEATVARVALTVKRLGQPGTAKEKVRQLEVHLKQTP